MTAAREPVTGRSDRQTTTAWRRARNPRFAAVAAERDLAVPSRLAELESAVQGDALALLDRLVEDRPDRIEDCCRAYADALGLSWIDLSRTLFQPQALAAIPAEFARRHQVIPVFAFAGELTVACADPRDRPVLDEAANLAGCPVVPVFARAADIQDAIAVEYADPGLVEGMEGLDLGGIDHDGEITADDLRDLAGSDGVVRLTRELLLIALGARASDIHIEPDRGQVRVRLRIDGVLSERLRLSQQVHQPLVSCLKIMAGCDIIEKRRPQDGRITLPMAGRSIDFRFSSVPGLGGEKVVLRVLGALQQRPIPGLDELGLSARHLTELRRLLATPNGVFFVTGPTGSGKTTTLYACLRHLNRADANVMTIEDPVEYRLAGANQVQVQPDIGLTFATALRAFLRQDPNIILVGEVRDMETARIASQAALTGHLVMSTMHTNNAIQAVTRLVEIGVEPFLVAPAIIGVMGQRLVRRICPRCRIGVAMDPRVSHRLFGIRPPPTIHHGTGCTACKGTGYAGRVAIHELFTLTPAVRQLIARNASILDIQDLARAHGFEPMVVDGLKKVLRGVTTLAEIHRVTADPDLVP